MATPILAGPGAMSLALGLLSYGRSWVQYGATSPVCFLISVLTLVCLYYSDSLVKVISMNAMGAINRILGLLILAIGVDLMVEGIKDIFFPSMSRSHVAVCLLLIVPLGYLAICAILYLQQDQMIFRASPSSQSETTP